MKKRFAFGRFILVCLFLAYVALVISLTLFDVKYGRTALKVFSNWSTSRFSNYLKESINLMPLHTINNYFVALRHGNISFKGFAINIFGNLIAFMPFAFFLPVIFRRVNNYFKFLLFIILIVSIIELLQFALLTGSCDIDDLILNVVGASLMYGILKMKFANKYMRRIKNW